MGVARLMFCSNGFGSLAGLVASTRADGEIMVFRTGPDREVGS